MMMEISVARYEELLEYELFLNCLKCAGVDNWDGYEFAQDDYRERTE